MIAQRRGMEAQAGKRRRQNESQIVRMKNICADSALRLDSQRFVAGCRSAAARQFERSGQH
jgi:hypothetical protein